MEKITGIKKSVIEQVLWAETALNGKSGTEKKEAVIKKLGSIDSEVVSSLIEQVCEKLNYMTRRNFMGLELSDEVKEGLAAALEVKDYE